MARTVCRSRYTYVRMYVRSSGPVVSMVVRGIRDQHLAPKPGRLGVGLLMCMLLPVSPQVHASTLVMKLQLFIQVSRGTADHPHQRALQLKQCSTL